MSEWRDIETAPKDGGYNKSVLVAHAGEPYLAAFDRIACAWYLFEDTSIRLYPTHWMPLPAPPATQGEG